MTRKKVFLLVLIVFVFILNSVNAQDLVGYWNFDDCTAADFSGNGNDGTINGNPTCESDCPSDSCFKFDGIDDHVRINNFGDFSDGFTVILWFNMGQRVNMQRPISSIFFSTCYISDLAPYSMPCYLGDGISFPSYQSTSGWSYDTWTHFAMTYDTATGDWIIYRNGNPVGTDSSSVVMDMTNYFCIGANCWATGSEDNFNGTIDEVKIYNRALTSDEVLADYTGTSTTTPIGQVSVYGKLVDNNDQGIDADVTIYDPTNDQEVTSDDTDSSGNYGLSIVPGTYDLQYYLTNFYIPDYSIKLPSFDILSNVANVINYIAWDSVNDRVSFTVDVSNDQEIQINSEREPVSVKANGIELSKPTTLPLSENEWTYSSGEIRMIVSPATITTTTIPTTTTPLPTEADYIVTGSDSYYEAIRVSDGQIISSGSDAVDVINDVLNEMTSGQKVDFIGDFTIERATDRIYNKILDFSQARVTTSAGPYTQAALQLRTGTTVLGGHEIVDGVFTKNPENDGGHFVGSGVPTESAIMCAGENILINGLDISNYHGIYSTGDLPGVIAFADSTDNSIIQNCLIHDNPDNYAINLVAGTNNKVLNCHIYMSKTYPTGTRGPGIMVNPGTNYLRIEGCEFAHLLSHAIYCDGSSSGTDIGHNTIVNNSFHDIHGGGAACHIKTHDNEIAYNNFYDWTQSYTISLYSELVGYTANDNDIHHNTFTNCKNAIVFGHGNQAASPTVGNLVHDNVFTDCENTVNLIGGILPPEETVRRGCPGGQSCPGPVVDTKIYYNDFHNCANSFTSFSGIINQNQNTVIAYNDFDASVPEYPVLTGWVNTLSYGNQPWLADYPDPLPSDLPIPPPTPYTITGVNGVYTGAENIDPFRTTSDSDAATVITTVLGWMSSGQSVEFIGDFTIDSTVVVNKDTITMNFHQATMNLPGNNWLFKVITHDVKILGGYWIGNIAAGAYNTAIRFDNNAHHCLVDGVNMEQFFWAIVCQPMSGVTETCNYHTIQNSNFYDMTGSWTEGALVFNDGGYNKISNCTFDNLSQGIFFDGDTSSHNEVVDCTFSRYSGTASGHGIYVGGDDGDFDIDGNNLFHGCEFYEPYYGAALLLKCKNNKVYDNYFHDFSNPSVVLSIYSEWPGYTANDNEIYDNVFEDIYQAIWIGHGHAPSGTATDPTTDNKIYNNTFTRVTRCFELNPGSACIAPVDDTWIYYNTFDSCGTLFPISGSPLNLIRNTVVAYNDFGGNYPGDLATLQQYQNSLVYGNVGMDKYPDPLPPDLPIPSPP